jgi:hypothetical protein
MNDWVVHKAGLEEGNGLTHFMTLALYRGEIPVL